MRTIEIMILLVFGSFAGIGMLGMGKDVIRDIFFVLREERDPLTIPFILLALVSLLAALLCLVGSFYYLWKE